MTWKNTKLTVKLLLSVALVVGAMIVVLELLFIHSQSTGNKAMLDYALHLGQSLQKEQREYSEAIIENQNKAAKQGLASKLEGLTGLIAKMASTSLATYDFESLNSYCRDACRDADVILCYITDKEGNTLTTYSNRDDEHLRAVLGEVAPDKTLTLKHVLTMLKSNQNYIEVADEVVNQEGEVVARVVTLAHLESVERQREKSMLQFREASKAMDRQFQSLIDQTGTLASEQKKQALSQGAIAGLACLAVALLFLTFIVSRSITRPLSRSVTFARNIAEGDLTANLELDQKDEVGLLADALRTMVANLKNKIDEANKAMEEAAHEAERAQKATTEAEEAKQAAEMAKTEGMNAAAERLSTIVERVTSASEELSAQVEESSRGAETQRERAGEAATAMEEMNASVLEVAKSASSAAKNAESARSTAESGENVVVKVAASVASVQQRAETMKENLSDLGKQAEGIGEIMNVITDIADQTNLLALNAAIEAARAGDAGRGFAVVADEVRKLAEKTMSATKEVGAVVSSIQEGTKSNIRDMDKTYEAVGQSATLVNEAGDSLREIVGIVEATADQVRGIATASEEQSAASEEINRGSEEISRIASETSEAMNQSARAVAEMAQLSQELQRLIRELRQS